MEGISKALAGLRVSPGIGEQALHEAIAEALAQAGIPFIHEAALAPRCRIDFLVGTVGLEVKCGKPPRARLISQLTRYATCDQVSALVLVVERTADLPKTILGKPCKLFGLNRLWGIALK